MSCWSSTMCSVWVFGTFASEWRIVFALPLQGRTLWRRAEKLVYLKRTFLAATKNATGQ